MKEGKNSPALVSIWRKWCQSQHIHVCLQTLLSEHVLNPHPPLCLDSYQLSPDSLHFPPKSLSQPPSASHISSSPSPHLYSPTNSSDFPLFLGYQIPNMLTSLCHLAIAQLNSLLSSVASLAPAPPPAGAKEAAREAVLQEGMHHS